MRKGLAPAFSVAAARGCAAGVAAAASELCDSLLRQEELLREAAAAAAAAAGDDERKGGEKERGGSKKKGKRGEEEDEGAHDPSLVVLSCSSSSRSPPPPSPSPSLSILVNADALGMRLALAAVGRSTLGIDFGAAEVDRRCAPVAALAVALPEAQASMTNPLRLFSRDKRAREATAARREFREAVLKASTSLRERAREAGGASGERRKGEGPRPPPPLPAAASALAAVLDPATGRPLSPAALAAEVGTLVLGGFETTGHVLAFALLRVAACPRARAEVERELRDAGLLLAPPSPPSSPPSSSRSSSSSPYPLSPRLPSSADLRGLPYLQAVAKEALRLHPTVPGVPRLSSREITLPPPSAGGNAVVIPAGTFVYALTRHGQRSGAEWGADALEFRSERWLEAGAEEEKEEEKEEGGREKEKRRRRPFYAPFSLGPRDCAGKTLALVTLHAALAVVCSRFELVKVEESYEKIGREEGKGNCDDDRGTSSSSSSSYSSCSSPSSSSSSSPSSSSSSSLIDRPEEMALTAHPARPLLKLVPR